MASVFQQKLVETPVERIDLFDAQYSVLHELCFKREFQLYKRVSNQCLIVFMYSYQELLMLCDLLFLFN